MPAAEEKAGLRFVICDLTKICDLRLTKICDFRFAIGDFRNHKSQIAIHQCLTGSGRKGSHPVNRSTTEVRRKKLARYKGAVFRLCRPEGMKLFLKRARCFTDNCPVE